MFRHPSLHRFLGAAVLVVLGAAAFAGCAGNSTLVNMWRDPAYNQPPMQSVLVVAVRRNPTMRRTLEDAFVHQLEKHGVRATPSYGRFAEAPPDTSQIDDLVNAGGYDGLILATRLPTERSTSYVPGYVSTQPVSYVSPWSGRYRTYWVDVMHPGYVERDVTVRHEVELWNLRSGGRLVWTGTGETLNPSSPAEVNHDVAKNVVPELARQGFIPRKA